MIEGFVFVISVMVAICADYSVFRWNRQNDLIFWAHSTKTLVWVAAMFIIGYALQQWMIGAFIAVAVAGSMSITIYSLTVLFIRRYVSRNARRGMAAALARLEGRCER